MRQQILDKSKKTLNNINNTEKGITKKKTTIFLMEVIKNNLKVSIQENNQTQDQKSEKKLSIYGPKTKNTIQLQQLIFKKIDFGG